MENFLKLWKTLQELLAEIGKMIKTGDVTALIALVLALCFLTPPFILAKAISLLGVKLPVWYTLEVWAGGLAAVLVIGLVAMALLRKKPETPPPPPLKYEAIKELRPFEAGDADVFAKLERGAMVQKIIGVVQSQDFRLGLLYSESGCGKTSFLRAGLQPNAAVPQRCLYVKFTDMEPLETLRLAATDPATLNVPLDRLAAATTLPALLNAILQADPRPVVLLFDQFEQYFLHLQQPLETDPFAKGLADWYQQRPPVPVKILISLRKDFMDLFEDLKKVARLEIGINDSFRLKKFSPAQATNIWQVMATEAGMAFDRDFVLGMAQKELADAQGFLSPVDVQILAAMLAEQTGDNRAFTAVAFNRLGGIEGLLERFLEAKLDSLATVPRERSVKVLLALTDLDRNARAGVLPLAQIHANLAGSVAEADLLDTVEWLEGARLVTAVERGTGALGYELAHERLIAALRKVGDRVLTAATQASTLLDRRVNEWLGNAQSARFLLTLPEWWQINRHRPQLIWGVLRAQKEALLAQTLTKWKGRLVGASVVVLLLAGGWAALQIDQVIIWQTKHALWGLAQDRPTDNAAQVSQVDSYLLDGQVDEALAVARVIKDEGFKASALDSVAVAYAKLGDGAQGGRVLGEALAVARILADEDDKARALVSIAAAYGALGDGAQGGRVLGEALAVARILADEYSKASALVSIAAAYGQLGDGAQGGRVLGKALAVVRTIADDGYKASALGSIAEAAGALGDGAQGGRVLGEALAVARILANEDVKANTLGYIAAAAGALGDGAQGGRVLGEALAVARTIAGEGYKTSALVSIAAAYGQLGDGAQGGRVLGKALAVARTIADEDGKARALGSIAEAYGALGDGAQGGRVLGEAVAVAKTIADDRYKASALASIAEATGKLGDGAQGGRVLAEALAAAKTIADDGYKASALGFIAEATGKLGDGAQGGRVLAEALAVARTIADEDDKARALGFIAEATAKLGLWKMAFEAAQDVKIDSRAEVLYKIHKAWHTQQPPTPTPHPPKPTPTK